MTSVSASLQEKLSNTSAILGSSASATPWAELLSGDPTNWIVTGPGISGQHIVTAAIHAVGSRQDYISVTLAGGVFSTSEGSVYTVSFSLGTNQPIEPVICFGAGTRLLTATGYKAIETLTTADKMKTSDGRIVAAKGLTFEVPVTTKASAPYRIEAGAFGPNKPAAPITLSPNHKIQIGPHLWTSPEDAAANGNKRVTQFGVGEPMRYYHIECENYLRDNLVAEGLVVESLSAAGAYKGVQVYTWNTRLKGYTRISAVTQKSQSK